MREVYFVGNLVHVSIPIVINICLTCAGAAEVWSVKNRKIPISAAMQPSAATHASNAHCVNEHLKALI